MALVVAAVVGLGVSPAQASATFTNGYCNFLYYPAWCTDSSNHTYDDNTARYDGYPHIYICEKLEYNNTQFDVVYSLRCRTGSRITGYSDDTGRAPRLNYNVYMEALVCNCSNSRHTVSGLAHA